MLNAVIAGAAGLACGILSGLGIGGGTLLMVCMTALLNVEQQSAQGINLLYYLPTAAVALIFHARNKEVVWRAVFPAAAAGCCAAVLGAMLAAHVDAQLLRRLFGGFLILVGLRELAQKGGT